MSQYGLVVCMEQQPFSLIKVTVQVSASLACLFVVALLAHTVCSIFKL
jgi:hypothetical protein